MDKKINFKKILVQTSLFIYLFSIFLIQNSTLNLNSTFSTLNSGIKSLFILLSLFFAIFFNKYTKKMIVILISVLLILLVVRLKAGTSPLLDLLIILLGIRTIPLRSILKTYLFAQISSSIIVLLLYYFNFIPDRAIIRDGILRSSLGFWHPNTTGLVLMGIFILSLLLLDKKYKVLLVLSFSILSYFTFLLTNSRTSFLLIIFASILTILHVILEDEKMLFINWRYFIPCVITVLGIFSFLTSYLYLRGEYSGLLADLNVLLSNRISIGSRFINEYGISLFGTNVDYVSPNFFSQTIIGAEYRVLDNVYLKYLLNYGLATISLLVFYFVLVMRNVSRNQITATNIYLLIFLIFGISEQSAFSLSINFFMLYGVLIFDSGRIKDEGKQ